MGNRKKKTAESRKAFLKNQYFAKLCNASFSPRKMDIVVNMIRGMEVFRALGILKLANKKAASNLVEKLLRSAISNWEQKTEKRAEIGMLFVSSVYVDCANTLKRMRPAPQGRGHRIRKRSNHVTLFVSTLSADNSLN
jgi:large subunit ribosomal protein L22